MPVNALAIIALCPFMLSAIEMTAPTPSSTAKLSQDASIDRFVIGSGGGHSISARFIVQGTAGQMEPNPTASASVRYKVTGGFWSASTTSVTDPDLVFKNGFE